MNDIVASFDWGSIRIERGRTSDYQFTIYEVDGVTGIELAASDVVRFKLYRDDDPSPVLDLDSVQATDNGSLVSVDQRTPAPALATVRFAQDDTSKLVYREYRGELTVVDDSETTPPDAIKTAGRGRVKVAPSPGGDVGIN